MLNIVLVQPEIPQNTGNIARTCAVTGCRLHIVLPMGFSITDSKLKRAGLDYWHSLDITYYDCFDDAIAHADRFYLATTKAIRRHSDIEFRDGDYLVFGPETRGLDMSIINAYPDNSMRIPMLPSLRSLNLSNAVAITVYEALRQLSYPGMI